MNQLSKQLHEMKAAHQHLQEDHNKQAKKLHQKNNQTLKYETQLHQLKSRNQNMTDEVKVSPD